MSNITRTEMIQRLNAAFTGRQAGELYQILNGIVDNLEELSDAELAYLDGITAGTATASKALVMDSSNEIEGVTVEELKALNVEGKIRFFDDFLAAAIDGKFSSTAGSGTGNEAATTVSNGVGGEITLKSASDDGAHSANCTTLTLDQLNFTADMGGLTLEIRAKISDVSEAVMFIGFTDTISTTVELPIFMNAADIDSDAADACGLIYDVDATTDRWTVGGVKANTDTSPTTHASLAPLDDVYFIARVEVSAAGSVTAYINGTAIGTVANAITATTAITPCVVIGNRSANQVTATIDYFEVTADR